MNAKLLLPHSYRKPGWIMIGIGILSSFFFWNESQPEFLSINVFAVYSGGLMESDKLFSMIENNIYDELLTILIIVGSLFVAFSKEIDEDEFSRKIRLESILWATYFNYIILIIMTIFFYDFSYLNIMIFNMFTILFLFIFKYTTSTMKLKRALDEK